MYLFLDVDGTIINYKGKTPESARKALRQAQQNGHKLIVCTGCSECEIDGRNMDIDFDGIIGGNGCYVRMEDKVVFHKPLTKEQCRHFVDWCMQRDLAFRLECNSGMYLSEGYEEKTKITRVKYAYGNDWQGKQAPPLTPWMINGELYRDDVNKTAFILKSYQDYLDAKEEFKDLVVDTWGGKGELALYGAVRCGGVDKKTSIQMLLDYMKVSKEETIAFGDGLVDIPMFEVCGSSVAMGNATEQVKKAATYVTDDVDRDGMEKALRHFGFI